MTPEEAAKATFIFGDPRSAEIMAFIGDAGTDDLQEFLQGIQADSRSSYFNCARAALDRRLAEDAAKSTEELTAETKRLVGLTSDLLFIAKEQKNLSAKLERQTNIIIYLTWALVLFSFALFAVALVQTEVMFKENSETHAQHVQTGQHDQAPGSNK